MARDSLPRNSRSRITAAELAISLMAAALCCVVLVAAPARGQYLVPAPSDFQPIKSGDAPTFSWWSSVQKIEAHDTSDFAPGASYQGLFVEFQLSSPEGLPRPPKPGDTDTAESLAQADAHFRSGMLEPALAIYESTIALEYTSIPAHLGRARVMTEQRRYKEAIADAQYILIRDPQHFKAMQISAFCSMELGLAGDGAALSAAAVMVDRALQREPTDTRARTIRGVLATRKGDLDRGIAELTYAIDHHAGWDRAYFERGLALNRKRAYERAIADFTTLIEKHPKEYRVYRCRARAYVEKKDLVHALADHDQIVRLRPDDPQVYLERSLVRWQNDDNAGATSDIDRFAQLAPNSFGVYFFHGAMACLVSHDDDRALADLNCAVALEPGFAFSYALRGYLHARKLQFAPAFSDFVLSIRRVSLLEFKLHYSVEKTAGQPDRFQVGIMWNYNPTRAAQEPRMNASNPDRQCIELAMNSLIGAAFAPAR